MVKVLDILRKYTQSAPVDVAGIARDLGLRVEAAYLGDGISGKIQRDKHGNYAILYNMHDSPARQRFTIAHEIAHYLYHRDLIGDGVSDSAAYRAPDPRIYANTPLEPKHETQANQFAANVLMPNDLVRRIEAENPDIGMTELARRLRVSLPALRVRKGLPPYPSATEEFDSIPSFDEY